MRILTPLRYVLILTALVMSPRVYAQGTQPQDPIALTTTFEPNPIQIDALDLRIQIPEGSVSETTSFGSNTSVGIGFPNQVGVLIIKEQRTTNDELTLDQVAQSIIKQLTRFGNSNTGTVLAHEKNLRIKLWEGQRFYIRIPGTNGKPDAVRGMTIFQTEPKRFIIFDLTTLYRDFDRCRIMYENTVATMDLGNPTDKDVRRAAAIRRMLEFIDLRSPEDIQSVTTRKSNDRWERLYLPAVTGDDMDATEYGYRRTRSWTGFKGDLSEKPRNKWSEDDKTMGYLVQIDAMALEEDLRVDTRATFYTSIDGDEESWTIKMSIRQGTEQQTSTITGARSKNNLVILTDASGAPPTKTSPLIQGEGYISQALSYLISPLLAKHAEPGDYASYVYNSSTGTITLRWDLVEHPEDSPDLVEITTKTSPETPATVSRYNGKGELLRVRLSNGRLWEPIEVERLVNLWQKKGLPLE
jgi:hypothetical protein